jgi:hypothetical protein
MTLRQNIAPSPRRLLDGVSGAWWLARWVFVLVVACDLLSAPFHRHHHDGVGGQTPGFVGVHASLGEPDSHAEDADHPLASHSAMAIRVDPSRLGRVPAGHDSDAQLALFFAVELLAIIHEAPPEQWWTDRYSPPFRTFRSLPPAGRAPPLHA